MVDETSDEIVYPSGEMDIKRRVAGEILGFFEDHGELPEDADLTGLIKIIFVEIRNTHLERIQAGRPINIAEEVKKYLV